MLRWHDNRLLRPDITMQHIIRCQPFLRPVEAGTVKCGRWRCKDMTIPDRCDLSRVGMCLLDKRISSQMGETIAIKPGHQQSILSKRDTLYGCVDPTWHFISYEGSL